MMIKENVSCLLDREGLEQVLIDLISNRLDFYTKQASVIQISAHVYSMVASRQNQIGIGTTMKISLPLIPRTNENLVTIKVNQK